MTEYKYNNNETIQYEYEYLNGKIRKYNKGKLKFEGEIIGEGKEYNDNGILIFEGEFLYGKRHGKGKEYNDNGKLIFEEEYLFGERHE